MRPAGILGDEPIAPIPEQGLHREVDRLAACPTEAEEERQCDHQRRGRDEAGTVSGRLGWRGRHD